jgi:hypothetical protein
MLTIVVGACGHCAAAAVVCSEIGAGLTGFGSLFLVLGILLFFDRAMLALGNLLFLSGITLLIGAKKTVVFFSRRQKWRGTACFLGGIAVVLIGQQQLQHKQKQRPHG